jgi:hypothetical protein
MISLFSFLRPANEPADTVISPLMLSSEPDAGDLLAGLRDALSPFLPEGQNGLPDPAFFITAVTEQPVGLGNFVGQETIRGFTRVLKGGRLLVDVRFQLWAGTINVVEQQIEHLHTALLRARADLRQLGLLRLHAVETSLAEQIATLNAWRMTAVYRILYEYQYIAGDDAQSLIAQIPIHTDPEELESAERETAVVTDEMVRWDQEAAPPLIVNGRHTITRLWALTFIPGTAPGDPVQVLRTHTGASGAPATFATLEEFVTAVSDPSHPDSRHAEFTFASLDDFLAHFTISSETIPLGDWDEDGTLDIYQPGELRFGLPISLPSTNDRLEIAYQPGSDDPQFDQVAVLYLRAGNR